MARWVLGKPSLVDQAFSVEVGRRYREPFEHDPAFFDGRIERFPFRRPLDRGLERPHRSTSASPVRPPDATVHVRGRTPRLVGLLGGITAVTPEPAAQVRGLADVDARFVAKGNPHEIDTGFPGGSGKCGFHTRPLD